jgi:O-antigen/teichoic acid export membrane protein
VTSKEQQVRNSFIYLLPLIVSSIFPFIALPIFTRILTKEEYGILALAHIYAILVSGFANFGMTASYDRNYFKYRDDNSKAAQLLFSTLSFVISNFLVLATLTYFLRGEFAKLIIGNARYGNILFWAYCAQFFSTISYYYYSYFKNSEIAKSFVTYTIAGSIINFAISLFLVAYMKTGVIGIIYAQLISGIIIFCFLSYKFTSMTPFSLNRTILLDSLKISYPLTPTIFFGVIGTQFDKYMIGLLTSLGGVGIYSIAQKVASVTFTYMTSLQNVFSPQVYSRMFDFKKDGGQAVGIYLTPFIYISTAIAMIIAIFSEEIIYILTPSSYHGAMDIVTILSMYYGFLFFGKITPMQLIYTKKTHLCTVLSMVSIGLNVFLNVYFIMRWGAVGAAWGTFLAALISGLIYFIVAQRHYLIKWEYLKVSTIILTFFVSAVLIVVMRNASVDYAMRLIVKGAAIGLYVFLGIKFNVITMNNFNLIKSIFNLRNQLIKVTHR